MQPKMFVTLHSPEEIREFCRFCNQFDDAIDLLSGQMITDAKSLMGTLALGSAAGLSLMIHSNPSPSTEQLLSQVACFI